MTFDLPFVYYHLYTTLTSDNKISMKSSILSDLTSDELKYDPWPAICIQLLNPPAICIQLLNPPTCVIMWPAFSKIHSVLSDFTSLMILINSHCNQISRSSILSDFTIWPQMTSDLLFAYNYLTPKMYDNVTNFQQNP